jgi:hypothetical protein
VDRLCSVAVVPVRAEPRDDAERVTEILEGESVRVEEERDGWARIVTVYDYPGWVRAPTRSPAAPAIPSPRLGAISACRTSGAA